MQRRLLEAGLWTRVRSTFPGLIQREESLLAKGIPDCYYPGGWIELKVLRRTTLIEPHEFSVKWGISGPQAAWHYRWHRAGGVSHVIAAHYLADESLVYYIIKGEHVMHHYRLQPAPRLVQRGRLDWSFLARSTSPPLVCVEGDDASGRSDIGPRGVDRAQ